MTEFHQRHWGERFKEMGDKAEKVFEDVYKRHVKKAYTRYGFNRPRVPVQRMSRFVRATPDYVTSDGLVEVQGFGGARALKIKDSKFDELIEWEEKDGKPLRLFLYDQTTNRWALVAIDDLADPFMNGTHGVYPEGTSYRSIAVGDIPAVWTDVA